MWTTGFVVCFGTLFYFSGASFASSTEVLIVAGTVMLGLVLFGLIPFLFRLPAISRLPRIGLFLLILAIFAVEVWGFGYFSAYLRKVPHASPAFLDAIIGGLQLCLFIPLIIVGSSNFERTVKQLPKPAQE